MYLLLFAATLLHAAPGTPEPTPSEADWPAVSKVICDVAVEWEIMSPVERGAMLAEPTRFQRDLDTLRSRVAELADAPHLGDLSRFPSQAEVCARWDFKEALLKEMGDRAATDPALAAHYREIATATKSLQRPWGALAAAHANTNNVFDCRVALMTLRNAIGPDAFDRGEMPPIAPVWLFTERPRRSPGPR